MFKDASKDCIEIFDLDGTLTGETDKKSVLYNDRGFKTNSYWNLITRELVENKESFDNQARDWKERMQHQTDVDVIEESKKMTELGLQQFRSDCSNDDSVRNKATEITKLFFKHGVIRKDAVDYLRLRLKEGVTCIISTASYEDGAIGFVKGLVECGLLLEELSKKIIVIGNLIDWDKLKVTHMNVDTNKIKSIESRLKVDIEMIKPRIIAVFGDDPAINDRALLELGQMSFAIPTTTNEGASLPSNCVFATWPEILANESNLSNFHKNLLNEKSLQTSIK